jgi:hypothetical protein
LIIGIFGLLHAYTTRNYKLKIALFGELSLEEAIDLSRDRQILELQLIIIQPRHEPPETPLPTALLVLRDVIAVEDTAFSVDPLPSNEFVCRAVPWQRPSVLASLL